MSDVVKVTKNMQRDDKRVIKIEADNEIIMIMQTLCVHIHAKWEARKTPKYLFYHFPHMKNDTFKHKQQCSN